MVSKIEIWGMVIFILLATLTALADPGQIYGKIYTTDNKILEGIIRWDKNEASWDDILDGYKNLDSDKSRRSRDSGRRERKIKVLGVTVFKEEGDFDWNWGDEAQSGIRVGHSRTLIPDGDDQAILVLKSGEKVEMKNSSTDIGDGIRELLVEDKNEGITELYWEEIDKVEFESTPKLESGFGKRLYGTLTTRRGEAYTGFICWDIDEVYDTDILDGKDRQHNRKIEFSKIKSIESRSSQSSLVTMKDGRELRLEESNDVDSGNRGVAISDPALGRILISWDEFDFVEFKDPPPGPSYDSFDGGKRLHGTVYTESGEKYTGDIKWDDDEEYSWEMLNGNYEDAQFDIEFGFVKSIEKISSRSSTVTLKDGRSFKLRDSNDINSENKGIYVSTGQDEITVDWDEFEKVEFSK